MAYLYYVGLGDARPQEGSLAPATARGIRLDILSKVAAGKDLDDPVPDTSTDASVDQELTSPSMPGTRSFVKRFQIDDTNRAHFTGRIKFLPGEAKQTEIRPDGTRYTQVMKIVGVGPTAALSERKKFVWKLDRAKVLTLETVREP
jgi:hypothetical protein